MDKTNKARQDEVEDQILEELTECGMQADAKMTASGFYTHTSVLCIAVGTDHKNKDIKIICGPVSMVGLQMIKSAVDLAVRKRVEKLRNMEEENESKL